MNAQVHYFNPPRQQTVQSLHMVRLKLGDSGATVEQLQHMLWGLALYVGPIDGHFGTATERAVLRLQRQLNLWETGRFDQTTYEALRSDANCLIW